MKSAIESLKAKVEEIGELVESSEDADGAGDEVTDSVSKSSAEELNGLPEGSDVDELEDTNKAPDPAVKCSAKRKEGDNGKQLADDKMERRGKKQRKIEEAVDEET